MWAPGPKKTSGRRRRTAERGKPTSAICPEKTLHDAVGVPRFAGLAFITLNKSAHGGVLRYRGVRVAIQLRERVPDRVTGVSRECPDLTSATHAFLGSARGAEVRLDTHEPVH